MVLIRHRDPARAAVVRVLREEDASGATARRACGAGALSLATLLAAATSSRACATVRRIARRVDARLAALREARAATACAPAEIADLVCGARRTTPTAVLWIRSYVRARVAAFHFVLPAARCRPCVVRRCVGDADAALRTGVGQIAHLDLATAATERERGDGQRRSGKEGEAKQEASAHG